MAVTFSAEMMHNRVKLVLSCSILLTARDLYLLLDLHDVINFSEVHVPLAEDETLKMDN